MFFTRALSMNECLLAILIAIVLLCEGCSTKKKPCANFFYGSWRDTSSTYSNKIIFGENGDFSFNERDRLDSNTTSLSVKYELALDKNPIELIVFVDSTLEKKKATIEILSENRIYLRLLDENNNVVDSLYMQREKID